MRHLTLAYPVYGAGWTSESRLCPPSRVPAAMRSGPWRAEGRGPTNVLKIQIIQPCGVQPGPGRRPISRGGERGRRGCGGGQGRRWWKIICRSDSGQSGTGDKASRNGGREMERRQRGKGPEAARCSGGPEVFGSVVAPRYVRRAY